MKQLSVSKNEDVGKAIRRILFSNKDTKKIEISITTDRYEIYVYAENEHPGNNVVTVQKREVNDFLQKSIRDKDIEKIEVREASNGGVEIKFFEKGKTMAEVKKKEEMQTNQTSVGLGDFGVLGVLIETNMKKITDEKSTVIDAQVKKMIDEKSAVIDILKAEIERQRTEMESIKKEVGEVDTKIDTKIATAIKDLIAKIKAWWLKVKTPDIA